ncbi:MAG: MarR family transcriptional regulator [Nocardioidaceae bacterium]
MPSSSEPPLSELLCFDLYAASRAMTAVYRPLLTELGLTYPQYLVLHLLGEGEPRSIKQVSTALRLDHGTLTPLLRRLESRGLLTRRRRREDERVVEVALTAAGVSLQRRFADLRCRVLAEVGLDAEQARALQRTLRTLTETALDDRPRAG